MFAAPEEERDDVTGALDRLAGLCTLIEEIERSRGSGVGFVIAFVDVDATTPDGDHGPDTRQEAIGTVGTVLQIGTRATDTVLRYGAAQFLCVLPGSGMAGAKGRFDALRSQLAAAPGGAQMTFALTEWEADEDAAHLIARAERALEQARRNIQGAGADLRGGVPRGDPSGARVLVESSTVVSSGLTRLLADWQIIGADERTRLLALLQLHATTVSDQLQRNARLRG